MLFCCTLEIINDTLTAAAGSRKIIVINIKTKSVIAEFKGDSFITKLKFDNFSSIFFRTAESFQVTTLNLNINSTKTQSTNESTILHYWKEEESGNFEMVFKNKNYASNAITFDIDGIRVWKVNTVR